MLICFVFLTAIPTVNSRRQSSPLDGNNGVTNNILNAIVAPGDSLRPLTDTDRRLTETGSRQGERRHKRAPTRRPPEVVVSRKRGSGRITKRSTTPTGDGDIQIFVLTEDGDDSETAAAAAEVSGGAQRKHHVTYVTLTTATTNQTETVTTSTYILEDEGKYGSGYTYAKGLLKIAHLLHYVGIGILAFFVVQV